MISLKKKLVLVGCAFLSVSALWGAEKTVRVSGEFFLSPAAEISPKSAMAEAYQKAKDRALADAFGVKVQTWDMLARDDVSGAAFTSLSFHSSQGIIKKFDILTEGWKLEDSNDPKSPLRIYCEADVTVEKSDEEPDTAFFASLDGIRSRYYEGERATISVTVSKDSYLTIFYLNARLGGAKIFPNRSFKKNELEAEEKTKLRPITMLRETSGDEADRGWLMFVFTKKNIPFLSPSDKLIGADEINTWLAGIPVDERFFMLQPYLVLKEDF